MRHLFLGFVIIPIIEMVVLINVGGWIGVLPTIALVVATAALGVWMLRREGTATLARVQATLARGEIPETALVEGALLLIGGALLLTPGFVTDGIGFICLAPPSRMAIARAVLARGLARFARHQPGQTFDEHSQSLDGKFRVEDD
jgi:UPF0716 protein FxsA